LPAGLVDPVSWPEETTAAKKKRISGESGEMASPIVTFLDFLVSRSDFKNAA
jgi:hypothetical protein